MRPYDIYTDGSGTVGPGGWAWIRPEPGTGGSYVARSGFDPDSTNQRMEVTAAFMAVMDHMGLDITIYSDSAYVVNCFNERWYDGWRRRDWRSSQKGPVKNRDLWEPFIEVVEDHGRVQWVHIKGHAGHLWNEVADLHAGLARKEERSRPPQGGLMPPPEVLRRVQKSVS